MEDWKAVLIGIALAAGLKALDSVFKVVDRLLDHKLDQMEETDDDT